MEFLDNIFLDNSIRSLLYAFGIILLVWLFRKLLSQYVALLLYIPIKNHWKTVEKRTFVGLIIKPLGWFLTIIISVFVIDKLNFPEAWQFSIYGHGFEEILEKTGSGLILIYFLWVVLSFIDFIALILDIKAKVTIDKRDDQLILFFRDFFKAIIYILGVLLVLKVVFNRDISTILTGLSIVGAALALAAKESIENLIASFIIFFDKPFYSGDTVKVNNVTGTVEHIGLRSTRIRTADRTLVTVPNKQMVDSVVDNWSMRTFRRAEVKLEFENTNSTASIEQFIEAVNQLLTSMQPPVTKFSAFFSDYSKNGVTVSIEYFTEPFSMKEFNELKQRFNFSIRSLVESGQLKLASGGSDINIFNNDPGEGAAKSRPII